MADIVSAIFLSYITAQNRFKELSIEVVIKFHTKLL